MARKSKYIKITIAGHGDPSVGIWGDETTIQLERRFVDDKLPGDNPENRKFIKYNMKSIFKELFDDNRINAWFEDECSQCGDLKTRCRCNEL